jgi:hypothetical protein
MEKPVTSRSITTDYTATVAETALGPIEYAVVGRGAPVLVVHGSPGVSTPPS